ncbi:MAG: FkbM family methyltransferase [Candidatus Micrarchaeota archaeon]
MLARRLRGAVNIVLRVENWHEYLLDFLGMRSGAAEIRLRNGISFSVSPTDRSHKWGIAEVWCAEAYTPPGFGISERDVVVDIGSHIGAFTVFAASKARKGAVVGIEPFRESHTLLKRNLARNSLRAKTLRLGVSGRRETRRLYLFKRNSSLNGFYSFLSPRHAAVRCVTLDDVFRMCGIRRCDFLKLDCEGAEFNILLNSPPATLAKAGRIVLEYHERLARRSHSDIKEYLEENGFVVETRPNMLYARRPTENAR